MTIGIFTDIFIIAALLLLTFENIAMEDVHTQLLALPGDRDAAFFGVYDGHGGMMNMVFVI